MDIIGIASKSDLLSVAERAGAQFKKTRAGEWRSRCPIHKGDNDSAFAVYLSEDGKQRWKCYSGECGGGDVYDFVMALLKVDFVGAYRWLGGEDVKIDPAEIAKAAKARAEHARVIAEQKATEYAKALEDLRAAHTWEAYQQELHECPDARQLWRQRGLPDDWQDWWKLGYCPSFPVGTEAGRWLTPTLTIPVFGPANGNDWPVMNVRHRLLNPPKPNDKYRPERAGLQSVPYIANPYSGWNCDPILVLEGEVKSMVTFLTVWNERESIQVIGIPGKNQFRSIVANLQGHDVFICFDPDAEQQAIEAARQVKGKVITFPMKIDDAITGGAINRAGIKRILSMGRKV